MTIRKDGKEWGSDVTLEASPIMLDPHLGLGAAVVANAVRDLRKRDPVASLDALIWLLFGDGPLWLEILIDQELTPEEVLQCLISV